MAEPDAPGLSDALLRALLEGLTDGVVGVGADGRVVVWSAGAEAITGHRAAAALGRRCLVEPLAGALASGAPFEGNLALTHADGHSVLVEARVRPVRGAGDVSVGAVAILRHPGPPPTVEALRKLAATDPLTGLANRREIDGFLADRREELERSGRAFAVVLVDLDGLKRVNDTAGHAAGDQVLRRAAEALRDGCRAGDLVGRYGGDEFLVVLPGATGAAAVAVAGRLRSVLAGAGISASFGVAEACADEATEALIVQADAALYRAKGCGGGCVEAAG